MRVSGWDKFQHYKGKKPTWIRLYRDLLNNPEWGRLSGDAAKTLIGMWLIAAEDDGMTGKLPEISDLAYKLRISEEKLASNIKELGGWLIGVSRDGIEQVYTTSMPDQIRSEKRREETDLSSPSGDKRKKKAPAAPNYDPDFIRFWGAYPPRNGKKAGKKPASEQWRKLDMPHIDELLAILERHKKTKQWREGYIPDAARWLRNRGWEDDITDGIDGADPNGFEDPRYGELR